MQFTTFRSKEKDYDIYFKSEKLVYSQQENEKNVSQLFRKCINLVPSYFEPDKHGCSYLKREKSGIRAIWRPKKCSSQLLGKRKKIIDIYLMSEKLVRSNQENKKNVSQLFGNAKNWFIAISRLTNTVAAIWREIKVDPCYLETKKCRSQLLGARKNIRTSI